MKETLRLSPVLPLWFVLLIGTLRWLTVAYLIKFKFLNVLCITLYDLFVKLYILSTLHFIWATLNNTRNSFIFILHCSYFSLYLIRLLVSWGQELFSCSYFPEYQAYGLASSEHLHRNHNVALWPHGNYICLQGCWRDLNSRSLHIYTLAFCYHSVALPMSALFSYF